MYRILTISLLTTLLFLHPTAAQTTFRVMSYNVENLFDTEDNPLTEDDDFTPDGSRHWTRSRYYYKLQQIAKVITAAGEWSTPALVALCEVENDSVMTHLLQRTPLRQQHYRYCMTHGADSRGINSALLYQRDQFGYINHQEHPVRFSGRQHKPTRHILHAWGKVITGDTLDVFVCHFPSRYGGEKESERDRMDAARTLRHLCDSLMNIRRHPQLLIMGDFNDTPQDRSVAEIIVSNRLQNLFIGQSGSHKYQGVWNQLDQIIFSSERNSNPIRMKLVPGSNRIFSPAFLLTEDKTWLGIRPFRSYHGYNYEGGFSDHLPVTADFLFSE